MFKKIIALTLIAFASHAFALNDQEITKAVMTADEGEVDMAKIAMKKAQNQQVKDYAKMMADMHESHMKQTKELAKEQKISPKKSDTSKDLVKDVDTWKKDMKKADKDRFDKTYIDAQVTAHEKVLAAIDDTFIPQATNAALKAELQKTREVVASHLAKAKEIQTNVQ